MSRVIKLQLFYVTIWLFNNLYRLVLFNFVRHFLGIVAGYRISNRAQVDAVRFFTFGKLTVGKNTIVNRGCYLDNRRGLTIGENVVIAHDTKIYTLGHDINDPYFKTKGSSIVIGDYAVLFSNVLVMPGVTIGRGAVVLPGAVVTKNVPEMTIVGGNPAKEIGLRKNIHDKRIFKKYILPI